MNRLILFCAVLFSGSGMADDTLRTPLGFNQRSVLFSTNATNGINWSARRGVPPLSSTPPATPGQFTSVVTFGAVAFPTNPASIESNKPIQGELAKNMGFPASKIGTTMNVLRYAQVGAPYQSRPVSFLFGMEIPPPSVDETGAALVNVSNRVYWAAEPYSPNNAYDLKVMTIAAQTPVPTQGASLVVIAKDADGTLNFKVFDRGGVVVVSKNESELGGASEKLALLKANPLLSQSVLTLEQKLSLIDAVAAICEITINTHQEIGYYWSSAAARVFAIEPGPIEITWRKAVPLSAAPAGTNWVKIGDYFYRLYKANYVVSGEAFKTPRKMFWTEGTFRNTGKPILVPTSRVPGGVKVVFNRNFPSSVPSEIVVPGDPRNDTPQSQRKLILNTLWYDADQKQILAYNREGRAFVEFLGEAGSAQPWLGFEIVDVRRLPTPDDIEVNLGERMTAFRKPLNNLPPPDDSKLVPEAVNALSGQTFHFQHNIQGSERIELFAIRETRNENDFFVHWMEEGVAGLRWPLIYGRYSLVWPANIADYSHYVRPAVATEAEAKETAIQIPSENVPVIDYQDPLDRPRAILLEGSRFYTFLGNYPAHRTLIRLTSGAEVRFERVFSWLESHLKGIATNSSGLSASVVGNLAGWNASNPSAVIANAAVSPRIVTNIVNVGDRIEAPEINNFRRLTNLVGYVRRSGGTGYSVTAYKDPFVVGFEAAAAGAIIPVNALTNLGHLEVWWFRPSVTDTAVLEQGFKPIYWPSVIGSYNIRWPEGGSEIVLASNHGSGALLSYQARGRIYYENDRSKDGYNPNEEHALMQGGQAWALRDDLNVTSGTATAYTSHPFVLLEYIDPDGRPAIRTFRVLREKPEDKIRFDYEVAAGTVLQAPMPLPLLEKPLVTRVVGEAPKSYNEEIGFWGVSKTEQNENDVNLWRLTTAQRSVFKPYTALVMQSTSARLTTLWFIATKINDSAQTLEGVIADGNKKPIVLNTIAQPSGANALSAKRYRFGTPSTATLAVNAKVMIARGSETNWFGKVQAISVAGTAQPYVDVEFDAAIVPIPAQTANLLVALTAADPNPVKTGAWRLSTEPLPAAITDTDIQRFYAAFTLQDRKGNTWVYRGPHNAADNATLVMKFYYKTLPGFFFPSLALGAQPPAGTVTPYLRPRNDDGSFQGEAVYGDSDQNREGDANPLQITYRPVWPASVPVLDMAETLTLPKRGLPSVRGQSSLQILYQQSQIAGLSNPSVALHDSTREKVYKFGPKDQTGVLGQIPDTIRTQTSNGKTYFPNLPPHLSERFFFDPNRGQYGALVLRGKFVDEAVGEDYLLLNVLGTKDAAALTGLCLNDDERKTLWYEVFTNKEKGLRTDLELFVENEARPGTYVASSAKPVGPGDLAEITDDDQAVDSYALTAVGPGVGYVTLMAGNGLAFTPQEDPVSLHVIRVGETLHRGELKVLVPSNPLAEKVTLQQVVDLAGHSENYSFEWKIASPVDGAPPSVYSVKHQTLPGGEWSHIPFPLETDKISEAHVTAAGRVAAIKVDQLVKPVSPIASRTNLSVELKDGKLEFTIPNYAGNLVASNALTIRYNSGLELNATVASVTSPDKVTVSIDDGQSPAPPLDQITELNERILPGQSQSMLFREFEAPRTTYRELWLSLDINDALGARIYLDEQLVVVVNTGNGDTRVNTPPTGVGLVPLSDKAYRLNANLLSAGVISADRLRAKHRIAVELFSLAKAGAALKFNLQLEALEGTDETVANGWLPLDTKRYEDGVRAILGESADVRSLSDNYLIMRYDRKDGVFSQWTEPQLAEGWIKRALAGINPFNQRVSDLFNNRANTDASILSQAGQRWEGDVALNLESINNYGLIEIYETILRRGKGLSIGSGINYGPANDALLLSAGYLNDLYMMLGNEAMADAANPTIGIGTKDRTYGEVATALFAFKGQVLSLLDEELALLRGRDDFLQPGVETAPAYNRLFWNYTRGIDSGEVIYALNYNIQENNDTGVNGVINADDARKMYPQGHGDAYGHYLTALTGYYSLLLDRDFDWVPRTEAVTVLGKPVQVDYQDERKFAAAAAALARTGRQIFDLTWRHDYQPSRVSGWEHFSATRSNTNRASMASTRYWGMDHWATRTAQGAYLNWVIGNSLLPDVDRDPKHEGIQKIDRTTVPELTELPTTLEGLQTALDNAEIGLSPLGLSESSIAFDINPNQVVGGSNTTHFEQIFERAKSTLNNAVAAFDDSKDVTRLMRSEQDSLADFQARVGEQERAFEKSLIELYGTPYPEDIGPGQTYVQGYQGPDLIHYSYVENPEQTFGSLLDPKSPQEFKIDIQDVPENVKATLYDTFDFIKSASDPTYKDGEGKLFVKFNIGTHGFYEKPENWTGKRLSPGKIQQAISEFIAAHQKLRRILGDATGGSDGKGNLDKAIRIFNSQKQSLREIQSLESANLGFEEDIADLEATYEVGSKDISTAIETADKVAEFSKESLPSDTVFGLANGGDLAFPGRAIIFTAANIIRLGLLAHDANNFRVLQNDLRRKRTEILQKERLIADKQLQAQFRETVGELATSLLDMQDQLATINERLRAVDDAARKIQAAVAEGNRIQSEREFYRQRAAAVTQGFRTRDAAFRIFRNEKLERYKTLFDLAARYSFLAANAYDYETGLLNTPTGKKFINRIVSSRALGVMRNGEPQYAGSNTGDPGLSSALAEMKADWDVLKGRLGFNNPDAYGTTFSLRTENFRILPGADGIQNWKDVLEAARRENILDDADVRRYCLQLNTGDNQPVPGLVLTFSTSIAEGYNLFGRQLAGGDHNFSSSSFATKIFAAGVALEGYLGMDNPVANSTTLNTAGGVSQSDPSPTFLSNTALSATPYIYLIPVGVDTMRSPPLGDSSLIRSWSVEDVTIPLPFNIGGSDFSEKDLWQSADSLTETLFSPRKHQAFRPVSTTAAFTSAIYGGNGQLARSQFTNARLIGRSVWNTQWKLVIPGRTLLNDANDGLDRFLQTVTDVKLHLVTYSYSGN